MSFCFSDSVFGSHLRQICEKEKCPIPKFVLQCIYAVEQRGESLSLSIINLCGSLVTLNIQEWNYYKYEVKGQTLLAELSPNSLSPYQQFFFFFVRQDQVIIVLIKTKIEI